VATTWEKPQVFSSRELFSSAVFKKSTWRWCTQTVGENRSWGENDTFKTWPGFPEKVLTDFARANHGLFFAVFMVKSTGVSLSPVPIDLLHWQDLPNQFDEWTLRRIHWLISEMQFDNLQHQVYVIITSLWNKLQIPLTDTELGVLFGHTAGWANGTITWHLQYLTSD
jgi:hypothetical protein